MIPLDPRNDAASEGESEFEFSRRLIARGVPHADTSAARARTWQRLNQSIEQDARSRWRAGGWQPSFTVAACALTFVFGVWVGEREQPVSNTLSVSAEPLVLQSPRRTVSVREDEALVEAASARRASVESITILPSGNALEPSSVEDSEALVGTSGRVRSHSNVASGAAKSQVSQHLVDNVEGEPAPSAVDSVALPTVGSKGASVRPTWQNLANKGEYEAALVEIAQAGGYERVLGTASPEQLMLLSDVARATGQQQRALSALKRIVEQHASDPVAPLAALNMGNLLDKMGDGAGATKAFARYRALSPKGEFAEDALVRQLRSAVKAGKQALARKLVHQYEADFPDGRSAGEVAQLAEQLPEISVQADAGVDSL